MKNNLAKTGIRDGEILAKGRDKWKQVYVAVTGLNGQKPKKKKKEVGNKSITIIMFILTFLLCIEYHICSHYCSVIQQPISKNFFFIDL